MKTICVCLVLVFCGSVSMGDGSPSSKAPSTTNATKVPSTSDQKATVPPVVPSANKSEVTTQKPALPVTSDKPEVTKDINRTEVNTQTPTTNPTTVHQTERSSPTPTVPPTTETNNTYNPFSSFFSNIFNTIFRPSNTTTPQSNTSTPVRSFLNMLFPPSQSTNTSLSIPSSVQAMMGKLPKGFDSSLYQYVTSGKPMDMSGLTNLVSLLGPMVPTVLKQIGSKTPTSDKCNEDVGFAVQELMKGQMWAIKLIDAAGKPGKSLMEMNFNFYGDFDGCLTAESGINPATGRAVHADTCVASLSLPSFIGDMMPMKYNMDGTPILINWHLCVPITCDSKTVQQGVSKVLNSTGMLVYAVECHNEIKHGPVSEDSGAVGTIILTSIFAGLMLLGSAYDMNRRAKSGSGEEKKSKADMKKLHDIYTHVDKETSLSNGNGQVNGGYIPDMENGKVVEETGHAVHTTESKKKRESLCHRITMCFSAVTNGEKVLSVKPTPGSLTCLNGIRVLSIGWVMLGHTFFFLLPAVENKATTYSQLTTFNFQCILNGTLSVDSFFVLSGVLGTYLFLRAIEKEGGLKVKHMIMYYVHRYLRLTPAYAFILFLDMYMVTYLADGPQWTGMADKETCKNVWWTNLLYINNLYKNTATEMCVGWSWFLANDMQFYIIAPLALIPFAIGTKSPVKSISNIIGICVTLALILIGIVSNGVINSGLVTSDPNYFSHVYIAPWCRISAFAIGIAAGYFLHKSKGNFKMSIFMQGLGWLLALVIAMACTYATYDENAPGREKWGVEARTAYETMFRPMWAIVLCWVIIMCCSGKGGIVNWMLSWDFWQPLARLTYGAYLIHPILMMMAAGLIRTPIHFSAPWFVLLFFGFTCLSYCFAFILSMLVEAPLLNLEKILLGR